MTRINYTHDTRRGEHVATITVNGQDMGSARGKRRKDVEADAKRMAREIELTLNLL